MTSPGVSVAPPVDAEPARLAGRERIPMSSTTPTRTRRTIASAVVTVAGALTALCLAPAAVAAPESEDDYIVMLEGGTAVDRISQRLGGLLPAGAVTRTFDTLGGFVATNIPSVRRIAAEGMLRGRPGKRFARCRSRRRRR
ncbi:hypothetical protein [Microbacterium sp. SL75]|uniref:hypothetical protein n=1 Tax=Microbacterium sp. SL75 TaxID=2995140 RepID=UPI0022708895|nr:hypothetical protein [Microbacterium sp. SL75]WAC68564.1 hypothetical protein OVA17_13315 [Microbacterium sp. SL75]